jgi:hypothetical protein
MRVSRRSRLLPRLSLMAPPAPAFPLPLICRRLEFTNPTARKYLTAPTVAFRIALPEPLQSNLVAHTKAPIEGMSVARPPEPRARDPDRRPRRLDPTASRFLTLSPGTRSRPHRLPKERLLWCRVENQAVNSSKRNRVRRRSIAISAGARGRVSNQRLSEQVSPHHGRLTPRR